MKQLRYSKLIGLSLITSDSMTEKIKEVPYADDPIFGRKLEVLIVHLRFQIPLAIALDNVGSQFLYHCAYVIKVTLCYQRFN